MGECCLLWLVGKSRGIRVYVCTYMLTDEICPPIVEPESKPDVGFFFCLDSEFGNKHPGWWCIMSLNFDKEIA